MRRRLYEAVRGMESDMGLPHDIVITVFSDSLLELPHKELAGQLKKQLESVGVI